MGLESKITEDVTSVTSDNRVLGYLLKVQGSYFRNSGTKMKSKSIRMMEM